MGKSAWISIHALREEGDKSPLTGFPHQRDFYPRPPRGGRPIGYDPIVFDYDISIHALREEGDPQSSQKMASGSSFLSTPSARRATFELGARKVPMAFLSTPSARRATLYDHSLKGDLHISIHALREEGDASPPSATSK